MHPPIKSDEVVVLLKDYNGKLGTQMKAARAEGKTLFLIANKTGIHDSLKEDHQRRTVRVRPSLLP